MIKRIRLATRAAGVSAEPFAAAWPGAVAAWRTRVAELLGRVPVAAGNDA